MKLRRVETMRGINLVEQQRDGQLYWLDPEPRPSGQPTVSLVAIQLSPHRRDLTEAILREWVLRGAIYTKR